MSDDETAGRQLLAHAMRIANAKDASEADLVFAPS